jgi:hypothetical protein
MSSKFKTLNLCDVDLRCNTTQSLWWQPIHFPHIRRSYATYPNYTTPKSKPHSYTQTPAATETQQHNALPSPACHSDGDPSASPKRQRERVSPSRTCCDVNVPRNQVCGSNSFTRAMRFGMRTTWPVGAQIYICRRHSLTEFQCAYSTSFTQTILSSFIPVLEHLNPQYFLSCTSYLNPYINYDTQRIKMPSFHPYFPRLRHTTLSPTSPSPPALATESTASSPAPASPILAPAGASGGKGGA